MYQQQPVQAQPMPGYGTAAYVPPTYVNSIPTGYAAAAPPVMRPPTQPPQTAKFQNGPAQPYHDVWAAVLWLAALVAVFVLGIYNVSQAHPNLPSAYSYGKVTGLTIFAVAVAATLSIPLHYLTRHHAASLIYFGNVTYICLLAVFSVVSFAVGQIVGGVLMAVFTLIYVWWFAMVRSRIPFAAMCLSTSADIINRYPGTVMNAFSWLVVQIVFVVIWSFGLLNSQGPDPNNAVLWVWLFFFYWCTQVFNGIVHVTTCGVVGMWYFTGDCMPPNPTMGALRRASTYSLGSICFGSLIVAILKFIRAVVNQATRNENEFARCIAMCLINCLESLMQYFNDYAYVHIAVYGKSYIAAAKDTWNLVTHSGILGIINDQLLQFVYVMFVLGGGLVTGVATFLVGGSGGYFGIGFIIGMVVVSLLAGVVQSGVMTIFVCFAEEPMALQRSNPVFYDTLNRAMAGMPSS